MAGAGAAQQRAGPGGADLGRIRQLGSELGAAYDAELRQLDARIARMAGE